MPRHVLVPMDDSETARAALEHALEWVPAERVTVVHAIDDLEADYGGTVSADRDPDFFDDARAIADENDRTVETAVIEGSGPADAILEYVDEADVDAIVMGSEGKAGVSRVLLGSVAEAVTRRATIPVTIVSRGERE
ncbi:universal stress protein [Natrinema salifodinae]|uniref:Nucleotide-binding universal stress protein, UspA family n=1 Tax=Natrinema salifodinae TaxID=1202768 RepID=A0A1I0QID1_9EURY|nr:universal stress protein [Natrinema salifodinae]SEW26855.1 Nucleotide-binding universal stress protein, UspA family [Natrinema salifodinae]